MDYTLPEFAKTIKVDISSPIANALKEIKTGLPVIFRELLLANLVALTADGYVAVN